MRAIALILASIATGFAAENTQALFKELAASGTPSVRREEIVAELSARTFSEVGSQAAQTICRSQSFGVYNPMKSKQWLEDRCPESERIRCAAGTIWHAVTERAEAGSLSEPLAKLCLEDRPEGERMIYLNALFYRHYDHRAKAPLERLAHDKAQPPEIGVKAAEILVQKADANAYIRALIEACDRDNDSLRRSEGFRFATQRLAGRISVETKALILNYGFAQLSKIDDGNSGRGYFLAMHLGSIIGIKPIRDGQGAFAPDQRLQKYQGGHGLKDSFFQDTVNNAQDWWRKNKKDYVPEA